MLLLVVVAITFVINDKKTGRLFVEYNWRKMCGDFRSQCEKIYGTKLRLVSRGENLDIISTFTGRLWFFYGD